MKKLAIVTLFATLATASFANEMSKGFYAQGDLGYSKLQTVDVIDDTSFTQRISAGYDFGNFRAALDFTNYGSYSDKVDVGSYDITLKAKAKSAGLTGFYDFSNNSKFEPYIGARLSVNSFDLNANVAAYGDYGYAEGTATEVGFGVVGGVNYKLTDKIGLNLGIEANRLAEDTPQVGINAGLRAYF